jgi:hypothetical protein
MAHASRLPAGLKAGDVKSRSPFFQGIIASSVVNAATSPLQPLTVPAAFSAGFGTKPGEVRRFRFD